jgi:predicted nucleic-acid-binding protein
MAGWCWCPPSTSRRICSGIAPRCSGTRYQLLERLVRIRGVVVDDIDAVIDALEQFRLGGDLADQLFLARATNTGALPVLSFDRRFAASEAVELLRPG